MTDALRIVVAGAGAFGRELWCALRVDGIVACFADDCPPKLDLLDRIGARYIGGLDGIVDSDRYLIAIGSPSVRRRIDEALIAKSRTPASAFVSAMVYRGFDVELLDGVIVCPNSSLTTNIRIGRHVLINQNCSIGHDVSIGAYSVISPLVAISGGVSVGEDVYIGTGASVLPNLKIGARAIVGAGAVVTKDVLPDVTVVGIPARARNG